MPTRDCFHRLHDGVGKASTTYMHPTVITKDRRVLLRGLCGASYIVVERQGLLRQNGCREATEGTSVKQQSGALDLEVITYVRRVGVSPCYTA